MQQHLLVLWLPQLQVLMINKLFSTITFNVYKLVKGRIAWKNSKSKFGSKPWAIHLNLFNYIIILVLQIASNLVKG